jgi:hypothetical protein
VPPPEKSNYNLSNNSFVIDTLLDGNIVELDYLQECGRFIDDTPEILKQIQATKQIPDLFKNKVASLDMDRHLCLTNKKKDYINKVVSLRICNNTSEKKIITANGGYCVNMILLSNGNHILYHINDKGERKNMSLKNNFEYKIIDINLDEQTFNLLCITTNETINNLKLYKVINFFKHSYCFTVDGAQGMKITEPFSIWQMNILLFNLNRVISSFGRTISKDLIHTDLKNFNKVFEPHEYKQSIEIIKKGLDVDKKYEKTLYYKIILKERIETIGAEYKNVIHYNPDGTLEIVWQKNKDINYNEKIIYIGLTTRTLAQRLAEHWQTAKGHTICRFHKFLLNANPEDIEIHLIEEVKHINKADAELYESNLINSYNESMANDNDKLLNAKLEINNNKTKEAINITKEKHIIDMETYNVIKRGYKIVEPVIYNNENAKNIYIYYWVDKEKKQQKIGYARIGFEKGLEKANEEVIKIKELYNNTK